MTPAMTKRQYFSRLAVCLVLLAVGVAVGPGIGTRSGEIGLIRAWSSFFDSAGDPVAYDIAFGLRLPRTLLALTVGATLALCGATFQVLFRNVLATPYTLGIAGGGSLGALLSIVAGWQFVIWGVSTVAIAAFCGSTAVVGLLMLMTRGGRRLGSNELLLAGVTIGLFCSAMMMLVLSLATARETLAIIRWTLGSLDTVGHLPVASTLPFVVPAWVVLIGSARSLNQYGMGELLAAGRGVDVRRLQRVCIVMASLATAGVVSVCGPIGFVGLVVPHMVRLVWGSDCRLLLPASAITGGLFVIICDWLSQLLPTWYGQLTGVSLGGLTLNIGVVTAVVGVPIFLALLRASASR